MRRGWVGPRGLSSLVAANLWRHPTGHACLFRWFFAMIKELLLLPLILWVWLLSRVPRVFLARSSHVPLSSQITPSPPSFSSPSPADSRRRCAPQALQSISIKMRQSPCRVENVGHSVSSRAQARALVFARLYLTLPLRFARARDLMACCRLLWCQFDKGIGEGGGINAGLERLWKSAGARRSAGR